MNGLSQGWLGLLHIKRLESFLGSSPHVYGCRHQVVLCDIGVGARSFALEPGNLPWAGEGVFFQGRVRPWLVGG